MQILSQLASQSGMKDGNYQTAALCVQTPVLLSEIITGLEDKNNKIVVDCAEVLTEVAKVQPNLVVPFGTLLPKLLYNKNNRARWEGMHCMALIGHLIPDVIHPHLAEFVDIFQNDPSVIVRDYAIDAIGAYAASSAEAARMAFPLLKKALPVWEGQHTGHVLEGLIRAAGYLPDDRPELEAIARAHLEAQSGAIRKSAKALLRKLGLK